jgi:GWxTD domain-containing protein
MPAGASPFRRILVLALVVAIAYPSVRLIWAAPQQSEKAKPTKEDKKRQKAIQKEMEGAYGKWIKEEVPYIITDEERATFKKLSTDDEREQFIEQFWERRNPNPGSADNEFKEEYYRRIAYANERYASGFPGWKTDRGRIYIMYGPPDEIESHPSGGSYMRTPQEGGGETATYPFEQWRYRYIDGIGQNIILEFVDPSMTGEYRLTMDPEEKDALLHVPGAGLTMNEAMGMSQKADRFMANNATNMGASQGAYGAPAEMSEFNRLDLYARIFKPPSVKFNDLKASVTSRVSANVLPFDIRWDFIRVTEESVLTPITIQISNRELHFDNKGGVMHAVLDIFGEVTTPSGRRATSFEDALALDVPENEFQRYVDRKSVYQKVVPLKPGLYKVSVVLKDDITGNMGSMDSSFKVPRIDEEQLATSSLILADLIQPIPTSQVGTGPFVIGGSKVRPSVKQQFTRDQNLGIYMQVYNLGISPETHKPIADIRFEISKDGKSLLNHTEDVAKMENAAQQVTLQKTMPLKALSPGKYTVQIVVKDNVKNQTLSPMTTTFELL